MNRPLLLDCTLRDGGYYTNWDFSPELVRRYLDVMAAIPVDIVELGFRSLAASEFRGAHAHTSDEFVRHLEVPASLRLGVMVNAGELVRHGDGPSAAVDRLFAPAESSPISLVRLAAHLREIESLEPAVKRLKELGYEVGLNLMQISEHPSEAISAAAASCASWGVDVFYFADSLGALDEPDVTRVMSAIGETWSGPIGVHTHDNLLRGLPNTMQARELGASWLDSTVLGMGRGPGNTRLEMLLLELNRVAGTDYALYELLELVEQHFKPLQELHSWGPSPLYFLAGAARVHPTYVQEMVQDGRYSLHDVLGALEFLGRGKGGSFSPASLQEATEGGGPESSGSWSADKWAQDRDVLLVAVGPGARDHLPALETYIRANGPRVVCLNLSTDLSPELIDAYAACHPTRLLIDADRYSQAGAPLIAPLSGLPQIVQSKLEGCEVLDYGLRVDPGHFDFGGTSSALPRPIAAAYGIALATAAGARRILLAGFDGFSADDARQEEMCSLLESYQAHPDALPVIAVTPSTYPVAHSSIYDPRLPEFE